MHTVITDVQQTLFFELWLQWDIMLLTAFCVGEQGQKQYCICHKMSGVLFSTVVNKYSSHSCVN